MRWTPLNYNVNLFHFARAQGKKTSDVLFWAVTIINCPREMRDVRLSIGSNAASVWWVNGKEVIGIYGDRQTVIDDGVSKRLTLNKGPNIVRAAIVNGGGATDFCARFLDAEDKPLKEITVSLGAVRAMRCTSTKREATLHMSAPEDLSPIRIGPNHFRRSKSRGISTMLAARASRTI